MIRFDKPVNAVQKITAIVVGAVMSFAVAMAVRAPGVAAAGGCCQYTSTCSTGETCCPGTGGAAACEPGDKSNYCKATSSVGDCNC